ncbi:MAG: NADH-quinone oxidoreductase subunit M [Fibrobacter sp.]|jgi:NADH-quinone oxidoreductase subunit M|nr:NADH-quinone oxidoreductase subunit M [Fibrobacter sp.]
MLLHFLTLAPFIAALLMVAASGRDSKSAFRLAVVFGSIFAAASIGLLLRGASITEPMEWFFVPGANITVYYALASHGFSMWLVFVSCLVSLAALVAGRDSFEGNYRNFAIGVFALLGAMNGMFLAADAVLFFFFFEAMVFPAAMLIASYGGAERKKAAIRFAIYTLVGSAPLLMGLWYLMTLAESSAPFELITIMLSLPESTRNLLLVCFALAFLVKSPIFPFHGWQAKTYAEAPAPVSAILTGAMSKAGIYGFLFWGLPLLSSDSLTSIFIWLGLITAVYGALMALRATDAKNLLAFSSMGHLGLAMAGLFVLSETSTPAVLVLLVAHALSASALFILIGAAERFAGSRDLGKMGGFVKSSPVFGFLFGFAGIVAVAVPGTAGFVGEFLVLLSLWNAGPLPALIAGICIVLSAAYMLRLIAAVIFGKPAAVRGETKISAAEVIAVLPMLLLAIYFGVRPAPIIDALAYRESPESVFEETDSAADEAEENENVQ